MATAWVTSGVRTRFVNEEHGQPLQDHNIQRVAFRHHVIAFFPECVCCPRSL